MFFVIQKERVRAHTSVGGRLSDRVCPFWHASNAIPPLLKITFYPTEAKTPSNGGTDRTKKGIWRSLRSQGQKVRKTTSLSWIEENKHLRLLTTIQTLHPGFVVVCHWKKCGGPTAVTSVKEVGVTAARPVIPGWRLLQQRERLAAEGNTRTACFQSGNSLVCVILNPDAYLKSIFTFLFQWPQITKRHPQHNGLTRHI